MLKSRFGEPGISRSPRSAPTRASRNCDLHASSFAILLLNLGGLLPFSRGLDRFVLLAWTNCQAPRAHFRTRTLLAAGTVTAILPCKGNPDAGIVVGISSGNLL